MSDDAMPAWAEAMEHRLAARQDEQTTELRALMNNQAERVLNRLSHVEGEVRDLRSEQDALRKFIMALPGTMLDALQDPLLRRIRRAEGRLDRLDGGEGAA